MNRSSLPSNYNRTSTRSKNTLPRTEKTPGLSPLYNSSRSPDSPEFRKSTHTHLDESKSSTIRSPHQRSGTLKSFLSFGALTQDPRFSFLRELKPPTRSSASNNDILAKNGKQLDLESLSFSQIQELAILILQKSPESRNQGEINLLLRSVETVDFFQKYEDYTKEQICKFMTYKTLNKSETLFEIGDIGTSFYIILKGSVGVWVHIPGKPQGSELTLTEVKVLGSGSAFGELALIDKKPRAATIICKESCHFGVLDKLAFEKILRKKEQKQLYENIEFLASMRLFGDWTFNSVKILFYQTESVKVQRNQFVYREGDQSRGLYFIRRGEFKEMKNVRIKRLKGESEDFGQLESLEFDRFFINVPKKSAFYFTREFQFGIFSKGSFFGEEELFDDSPRKSSVQCLTNEGEVFFLNKKEFQRRVLSEPSSLNYLKDFIQEKGRFSDRRMKTFVRTEKRFLLPRPLKTFAHFSPETPRNSPGKASPPLKPLESYAKTQDKTYEKIYSLLESSISNRKTEGLEAISEFESQEIKKMAKHRRFLEASKRFPKKLAVLSSEQNFLRKLLYFENANSVAKMMNRKLRLLNKTARVNDLSFALEKNKSL